MSELLRHFLCWKPTNEYLSDPWAYFVEFVRILQSRGARFITFKEALAGRHDRSQLNVILDHHIDTFPIETEAICRWELEQGIRSSVYLFNRSTRSNVVQGNGCYRLDDLDVGFYQNLESHGFEIGYHQNAVGLAREELLGNAMGSDFSEPIQRRAVEIFRDDVREFRRHFDIATFIPHGGGQGNYLLIDIPDECKDLVWVYNNASSSPAGDRKPDFANWTDTAALGVERQVIAGQRAYHVCRLDNLHVKAYLAGPGLHHILLHPGRFAKGMPCDMYRGPVPVGELRSCDFDDRGGTLPLPMSLHNWVKQAGRDPIAEAAQLDAECDQLANADGSHGRQGRYRLLTDDRRILGIHLLAHPDCIGHFARQQAFDRKALKLTRFRAPGTIRPPRPRDIPKPEDVIGKPGDAARPADASINIDDRFFNCTYSQRLFEHLRDSDLLFDVICLRSWTLQTEPQLRALLDFLLKYHEPDRTIDLQILVELPPDTCAAAMQTHPHFAKVGTRFRLALRPGAADNTTALTVSRDHRPATISVRLRQFGKRLVKKLG